MAHHRPIVMVTRASVRTWDRVQWSFQLSPDLAWFSDTLMVSSTNFQEKLEMIFLNEMSFFLKKEKVFKSRKTPVSTNVLSLPEV